MQLLVVHVIEHRLVPRYQLGLVGQAELLIHLGRAEHGRVVGQMADGPRRQPGITMAEDASPGDIIGPRPLVWKVPAEGADQPAQQLVAKLGLQQKVGEQGVAAHRIGHVHGRHGAAHR